MNMREQMILISNQYIRKQARQSACLDVNILTQTLFFTGGLEAFEENLRLEEEEREAVKRREEERRQEISTKTRNRLSKLLNRKIAENKHQLER